MTADNPSLQHWTAQIKAAVLSIEDRMQLRREAYRRAARIARIVQNERCNTIIACSGDLIDLPASCIAARWVRVPFYAYMFDDYATTSISRVQHQFSQKMMPRLMREATGVIVPNAFLALAYQTRYNINPWIIPNPVDLDASLPNKAGSVHHPPRLLYTGAVYEAHFDSLHRLLLALNSMAPAAPELHIYTSSTKQYLARHLIGQPAIIHGPVPTDESMRLQRNADILFLPLAFDSPIPETINTSAPGKMGELLASGRPVLVHAPKESFVSWYFRKHECGEVVDEKDPTKLRTAIDRLLHDVDRRQSLVSNARERARCDFALAIARYRFFEVLSHSTRRLVA
jgi:glycosyltransferase involved in cell wall biosynthesis